MAGHSSFILFLCSAFVTEIVAVVLISGHSGETTSLFMGNHLLYDLLFVCWGHVIAIRSIDSLRL